MSDPLTLFTRGGSSLPTIIRQTSTRAGLHPEAAALFDSLERSGILSGRPESQPLATARARAQSFWYPWNTGGPRMRLRRDLSLDGSDGPLAARLFIPCSASTEPPVIVYFHGGGYALNGLDTHDRLMRTLADASGAAVLGVGYALAPEHPFPTQAAQALSAIDWLLRRGRRDFAIDARRMALAGDSAGAHLALWTAQSMREADWPAARMLLLAYGMMVPRFDSASHALYGGGAYGLTTERMRWFWNAVPPAQGRPFTPLTAGLDDLPSCLVVGAGADCLRDDSRALAEALELRDAPVRFIEAEGLPHSFLQYAPALEPARRLLGDLASTLARSLESGAPVRWS
ncbi:lipolytic protein [Rhodospirillum rubrum]|uniref:alpha/beta hydrolase fold domain-containing protein n=1 Tax=Rhodospirillum rubrum TaxID=1085 RepID=UPI0019079397|nr:alpha/beta hydrolase fold domain-containing protein [Rhodospirillum rubrum]MBK1664008.1 lipolytic protein [Rhodospirillum rubrum]MBK1675434.1 lipolytic protein [Rhodospirillum rubrum]